MIILDQHTISGHLAVSEPADVVFLPVLQEQRAGTTWHSPCLCTRAVSWANQALPDRTWNSCCLGHTSLIKVRTTHSGNYWNCMVAAEIPELPHMDCVQGGNLLMPKVNHLMTLQTAVPCEAV